MYVLKVSEVKKDKMDMVLAVLAVLHQEINEKHPTIWSNSSLLYSGAVSFAARRSTCYFVFLLIVLKNSGRIAPIKKAILIIGHFFLEQNGIN